MTTEAIDHLSKLEDARYGQALLRLLALAGWDVAITKRFAGDGVLVCVRKPGGVEVCREGESVELVAPEVFMAAVRAQRDTGVRLRLVE